MFDGLATGSDPVPVWLKVRVKHLAGSTTKLAMRVLASFITIDQVPLPLSISSPAFAPLQPEKLQPSAGTGVNVTVVPKG